MIEELTPEQEAKLEEYKQRGLEIGLATGRINRKNGEKYAKKLMDFLGRPHKKTLFAEGPAEAWDMAKKNLEGAEQLTTVIWPYTDGQWSAYYAAWADYFSEVLEVELPDYSVIKEQCEFGLVYPMEEVVIICERPDVLEINDTGLHRDGGPAVHYPDGTSVWALNSVIVPKWLAETPDSELDPMEFAKIDNVEVRREFLRKVGVERISQKCGGRILDKTDDGVYELIEVDLGEQAGKWPCLKMRNPSIDAWHMEFVSQDCATVQDAINFRASRVKSVTGDWKPEKLT